MPYSLSSLFASFLTPPSSLPTAPSLPAGKIVNSYRQTSPEISNTILNRTIPFAIEGLVWWDFKLGFDLRVVDGTLPKTSLLARFHGSFSFVSSHPSRGNYGALFEANTVWSVAELC
ncbi:hypothetical protein E2542_SST04979 [Spatholobus suberectus]|nr:hypothetical protein E2542_SST04979 [Spatholobus suberectus]